VQIALNLVAYRSDHCSGVSLGQVLGRGHILWIYAARFPSQITDMSVVTSQFLSQIATLDSIVNTAPLGRDVKAHARINISSDAAKKANLVKACPKFT
jgi:hypothetical protein